MTDRHAGYIVTLEQDVREDDAEAIINALRMVRGVGSVEPIVSDHRNHIGEKRARLDMERRLFAVLRGGES